MKQSCQQKIKFLSSLLMAGIIITFIESCSHQEKDNDSKTAAELPSKTPIYKTAAIKFFDPEYEISLSGNLDPYEQVAIYAKVTGFVKKLYVDRGSRVNKGQLLALLEAPEMNQQYLSDKSLEKKIYSDYLFAVQTYQRLLDASKTAGAVAPIELERAKTTMESARSAYQASKAGTAGAAQLNNYLRIIAPFDGTITQRNISTGALAGKNAGEPLFWLAQGRLLRLTVSLPEKQAASVYPNMSATFTVSSLPGKVFNTTLSRTSRLINQESHSLALEFDVDNPTGEMQGGDYAQVKIKLRRQYPTFWVPNNGILNSQMGTFVLTLNNNEIKRIPITPGNNLDSLTEIFGNLQQGDSIILKPSEEIKLGRIN